MRWNFPHIEPTSLSHAHTAVFRTLNEARRLEPNRPINGAMRELVTAGYANLMTLGIRRLVDRDPRTDSLWNVIARVEKGPEVLSDDFTNNSAEEA